MTVTSVPVRTESMIIEGSTHAVSTLPISGWRSGTILESYRTHEGEQPCKCGSPGSCGYLGKCL
jgi:hypothetical protein